MPGLEWPERRTNGCLRGRVLLARDHGGPSAGRARPSRADASRLWTTRQPHPSHRLHPGTFRRPGPVPVRGPIGCGGPHSEYAGRGPIRPHCGSRSVRAGGELRVVTRSTPTTSRASPTPPRHETRFDRTAAPDHPLTAQGFNNLANVLHAPRRPRRCPHLHERALSIREATWDPTTPTP